MRVAVVIPALNEEKSLPHVISSIPAGVRVVVVDNGSSDGTGRVAGAEVVFEGRRGYGSAVKAGFRYLASDPPDIVVVMDADLADDPHRMEELISPIRHGRADLVLADRTGLAEKGALQPAQRFGNALAVRLIHWTSGHRYRDMGPFRAIRWSSLQTLAMEDPTWGWNVEMQLKAANRGLRILEVPLPYRARVAGTSKISGNLLGAAKAGARILWAVNHYRHK